MKVHPGAKRAVTMAYKKSGQDGRLRFIYETRGTWKVSTKDAQGDRYVTNGEQVWFYPEGKRLSPQNGEKVKLAGQLLRIARELEGEMGLADWANMGPRSVRKLRAMYDKYEAAVAELRDTLLRVDRGETNDSDTAWLSDDAFELGNMADELGSTLKIAAKGFRSLGNRLKGRY